ncbi:MAG: hypothetical protein KDK05_21050 [Candidatus Competibacteraceae bacterium]|nr:hypothetical protein [Candidatus Competibacteraceae bacterium]
MPKQGHRAEYSQRGVRFQALAASQLRYVAAIVAVLTVIAEHHAREAKAPCCEGA